MADNQTSIADFYKALKHSPFVMIGLDDTPDHAEPMTAQIAEGVHDTLWFFTGKDNRVAMGGDAMAQFASKGHDFFACLHGTLSEDDDPAMIDTLWSKQVEAWFPGGKSDPNLLLLRYDIGSAEMWEADLSRSGMVKMMFGGTIRPEEAGDHAEMTLRTA